MKRALITTVYNEANSIHRWIEALQVQTVRPDEFVIVDGGSTDNTVQLLCEGFERGDFPAPRIIVRRCNIAEGRNLAIRNTVNEIIAVTDAGAIPEPQWLEEITRPFQEVGDVGVVGGWCPVFAASAFQKRVAKYAEHERLPAGSDCYPSSRNTAFTRNAWAAVGGYPEWLTLTAEDALFDLNLHYAGLRFYFQPTAVVSWEMRPDLASYLKMTRSYGHGSAEAGQSVSSYRSWLLTTLFPPLILFSHHDLADAPLRYLRNAAASWGWIEGMLVGRKPPKDWQWLEGTWVSPQSFATRQQKESGILETEKHASGYSSNDQSKFPD